MKERKVAFTERIAATLIGYELRFHRKWKKYPGYCVANIVPKLQGIVEGALYTIPDNNIAKLDVYEGYPREYSRKDVRVTLHDHSEVSTVVYISNPKQIQENLPIHTDYLSHVLEGKDIVSNTYFEFLESFRARIGSEENATIS